MTVGTLTLHRFNGDEIFHVSEATVLYFIRNGYATLHFEVTAQQEPVKTLPDTESLHARPSGAWQLIVPSFDPIDFVGKTFSIPEGYDVQADEYVTNFYYVEHDAVDNADLAVLGREGERFHIRITGTVTDVNFYDGSKPPTRIVLEAGFRLLQAAEPLDPVG